MSMFLHKKGGEKLYKKMSEEMLNFIKKSPSVFHAARNIAEELKNDGFIELTENKKWNIEKGKKYYEYIKKNSDNMNISSNITA